MTAQKNLQWLINWQKPLQKFNPTPSSTVAPDTGEIAGQESSELLFNKDEQNERALIRNLLEFGNNAWNESLTVADYLFGEIAASELESHLENRQLASVLAIYKKWYDEDRKPTGQSFVYYEDKELSDLVINLMQSDTELSNNWKTRYEGHIPTRGELFKEEVFSSLNYLKLRKLKKMINENQLEMQQAATAEEQMSYVVTHQILKNLEIELTRQLGTVIYK